MENTHIAGSLKIEFEEHDFGNDMQFGHFKGRGWFYTVSKGEMVISNYVMDDENVTDDEVTELEKIIYTYKYTFKSGNTPVVDKTLFK
jgi:hypothetical protein